VSRITSTFFLWLAAILVSSCQTAAVSNSALIETVSIKEARSMSIGEPVRVSGTVTVQSGAFGSSSSSGFAVQDYSAGIYIVDAIHAFKLGDRVTVSGKRGAANGQLNIILESAEKLRGFGKVIPIRVKTGNVGESEEGILIQVEGYVTQTKDDPPYGYKVLIDDSSGEYQVFVNASTGLVERAKDWKVGDFVSVIGFAGQYETTHEIMPRIFSDITTHSTQE